MVTVQVDMLWESFPAEALIDGADVTAVNTTIIDGIAPDKLVVVEASGPGGGNPVCNATFKDERLARRWFAVLADDSDPDWFEENVVERV